MGKSSATVKDPFKSMYRGVHRSSKKSDGMHRPEGAGNFDNMDDHVISDLPIDPRLTAGGSGDIWVEKAGDTMTGPLTMDGTKIALGDTSSIEFGAGKDILLSWDNATSQFKIEPLGNRDLPIIFKGSANSGLLTWLEDEDRFQFDDDVLLLDNESLILGTGVDATISYDGSNLQIKPAVVGTGGVVIDATNVTDQGLLIENIGANVTGITVTSASNAQLLFDAGASARVTTDRGNQNSFAMEEHKTAGAQKWTAGMWKDPITASSGQNDDYKISISTHPTLGSVQFHIERDSPYHINLWTDDQAIKWGAANDCGISYDGTNMKVDPSLVGTGHIDLKCHATAITALTGNTTLDQTHSMVTCGAGNESFTVTLPAVAGVSGRIYTIKNVGTGTITIDGASAETIDGATTQVISTQYDSITIQCDGSTWWIR